MKQVFYYDQTSKQLTHIGIVDDNADMPANATFVQPQNGLFDPLTWTGADWVGVSQAEWENNQPVPVSVTPTTEQKFQAQLALQMATMQKNQAEFNAQVLLQLADLKESATSSTSATSSAAATTSSAAVTPATPATSETSSAAETPASSATPTATSTASTVENK